MGLFGNNKNTNGNRQNPQGAVLDLIENARANGKISTAQYEELMKNKNNPQGMVSVLLNNGINTNDQVANAKQYVNSFLGIK